MRVPAAADSPCLAPPVRLRTYTPCHGEHDNTDGLGPTRRPSARLARAGCDRTCRRRTERLVRSHVLLQRSDLLGCSHRVALGRSRARRSSEPRTWDWRRGPNRCGLCRRDGSSVLRGRLIPTSGPAADGRWDPPRPCEVVVGSRCRGGIGALARILRPVLGPLGLLGLEIRQRSVEVGERELEAGLEESSRDGASTGEGERWVGA